MCCLKGMALYVLGDGVACMGLALYVVDAVPHCQKGAVKALWDEYVFMYTRRHM